jgi:diguanylate cyclase (GGDEF)-like protein/PAS domain S-box-containing protein
MHKRADTGKVFPADVLLSAMELDGKLVLQATVRDISERRENEERIQQSEERMRAYLENISDTIWLINLNLDVGYVSPSVMRLLGMLPEELIGRPSSLAIHPDDMDIISGAMGYVMEHPGEPRTIMYRVSHKDGRWIYVESTGINMFGNPAISGVLVTMRDITGRKQAEEALRESENRYRLLVESSPLCIHEIDLEGRLQSMNKAGLNMLGLDDARKICGLSYLGAVSQQDAGRVGALLQDAISSGNPSYFEFAATGDVPLYFKSCFIPIKDSSGKVLKLMGITEDITERKQAEDALRESEASLRAILDNSPYLVWLKDTEGRYITSNMAHANYIRLKAPSEITGKTDLDFWPKDLAEKYRADDAEVMALRRQKRVEEQSIDGDRMHWVETYKTPVIDESGNVLGTTGFAIDITERKLVEEALLRSEKKFRTLFDSTSDMVMMMDEKGFFDANKAALEGTGCVSVEDFCSRHPADLSPPQQPGGTSSLILANQHIATAMEKGYHRFEWAMKRVDSGKIFPAELTLTAMDMDGKRFLQVVVRDITERKQVEEQIHNLAFYDTLTQLPNRRMLNDRMNQAMASSKRSGHYGALLFLDLDNFKPLNDNYGHMVGDLLLKEVARRISSCVREMDTVARFGGDEFVVMLTELFADKTESAAQAGIVAEKIRITLAETYVLKVQHGDQAEATVEHHCTSSIGVVLFINHKDSPEDILKWADLAMYQAKDDGRNLIRFHDSKG